MKKFLPVFLIVALAALAFTVPVLAQDETPPVTTEEAPLPPTPVDDGGDAVKFGGLLIAITAFFKKQLDLQKNQVILAAGVVFVFLWFAPDLAGLVPAAAPFLNKLFAGVTIFLAAMGSVDFVINTGAKIATATPKSVA